METYPTERPCTKCHVVKPMEDFPPDKRYRYGRNTWCRACKRPLKNAARDRWNKRNPDRVRKQAREYQKKYRLRPGVQKKNKARRALSYAVERGYVERQPCEVCGATKVHGHHDSYDRPLDVRWLCQKHHAAIHEHTRPV